MAREKSKYETYENPLVRRYASEEMLYIFSPQFKFSTWRRLWVALAEGERELGLPITKAQISQMKKKVEDIDFRLAARFEKELRHDVMAHVCTFGAQCPKAKPIIHLGATSAYVGDNTDLIQIRRAFGVILKGLVRAIDALGNFAYKYRNVPTLGYTHFQAAQPTTVGKRASLWTHDLLMDLEEVEFFLDTLKFLGVKGTTGTQASFLKLFEGNAKKVRNLDELVTRRMGFEAGFPVTGQTYPRKVDSRALGILSGIGQSAHKFANDLRLLSHLKEIEEPYEAKQVGSSAMPFKRNPMRCERMTALSRFLIANAQNPAMTAAEQWFERTLDDSANKRLSVAEGFLAADAVLVIYLNVARGLVVNEAMIRKHLSEEMPFIATENILMAAVRRGGDRQHLHERIREHSRKAQVQAKAGGESNDLLERLKKDPTFASVKNELEKLAKASEFTGLAPQQVADFIKRSVRPVRKKYSNLIKGRDVEMKV